MSGPGTVIDKLHSLPFKQVTVLRENGDIDTYSTVEMRAIDNMFLHSAVGVRWKEGTTFFCGSEETSKKMTKLWYI